MTRRVLALLATAVLALTGCYGDDPEALIAGASDALEDAGTARFEMVVSAAGDDAGSFTAEGAQDLGTGALRMAIDLGDEQSVTETLLIGSDVYVRSPLFELFTGDPDVWVRVDLAATAAEQGLDTEALLGGQTGPAALLAQLEGASDEIEELGTAEVRDVETRHLRVTVDTSAAIEQADEAVREQLRAYAEATGLPERYPMELWVDEDGLVRRIRTVLDVTDADGGGVTQETTLELFDFGVQVDLDPPLEERTVELADLVAELEELERLEGELPDDPAASDDPEASGDEAAPGPGTDG